MVAVSYMTRTPNVNLDYIRKLYAPQDKLLADINAALKQINMEIQIGAEEGKLLQLLIKTVQVKTIVELGTLAGYSTIWMARALPVGGQIYTVDNEPEHVALARGFFAQSDVKDRITSLEGDAVDVLKELSTKGPFDMMFIDADKIHYPDYLDWAEKNIRKGGLIVGDNTLLFGTVALDAPPQGIAPATWKNMRRFNERLADSSKYLSTLIPTQEGLTVAIKLF